MHETFGITHPKDPMHSKKTSSDLRLSRRRWLLGSDLWRALRGFRSGLHFARFALYAFNGLLVLLVNFLLLLVHARR